MKTLEKKTGTIILVKDSKEEDTYHVRESAHNSNPWDEGTMFYVSPEEVDNHYFIMQDHRDDHRESERIVGVAHDKDELKGKVHECAVKYCEMISRQRRKSFIDSTDFDVSLELPIPKNPEDYGEAIPNEEGYIEDPEKDLF